MLDARSKRPLTTFLNAYSVQWAKNLRLYPNQCLGFTGEGLLCLETVPSGNACPTHQPSRCATSKCRKRPESGSHFCADCLYHTKRTEVLPP
jgi:hypothetical protein